MDTRNKAALINKVLATKKEPLVRHLGKLDLSYLRGQAYDGASAMSSPRVGAQTYVKAERQIHMLITFIASHMF